MPGRADYLRKLQGIVDRLVVMCRYAESTVEKSIQALVERDLELIQEIHNEDKQIDKLERKIEKACLKLLVMEHPVASDFREVSATLKMVTDLERIGDQAKDITDITVQFKDEAYVKKLGQIPQMAIIVIQMVRDSIQAYINRDIELARSIDITDNKADELFEIIKAELIAMVRQDSNEAESAMMLMMVAKYLERIGDHAVNIGNWVEYAITGSHSKKK